MTREDAAMIQQQQINTTGPAAAAPHTQIISQQPINSQNVPQSPPNTQGHHRTSRYTQHRQLSQNITFCRYWKILNTVFSLFVHFHSAPPQGFGSPVGMIATQTQYNQQTPQPQQPQLQPLSQQQSSQLSQGSYGSNQVSSYRIQIYFDIRMVDFQSILNDFPIISSSFSNRTCHNTISNQFMCRQTPLKV